MNKKKNHCQSKSLYISNHKICSMEEEFDMTELADEAVEELKEFMNTQTKFVEKEHEFFSTIFSWDNVCLHLNQIIPVELTHLHNLNNNVVKKLNEIKELFESGTLFRLKIINEEKEILSKLEEDVKHKKWVAVKKDIDLITGEEKEEIRLEEHEIKDLHSRFVELSDMMKKSKIESVLKDDSVDKKEKFVKQEEYYFLQIYKFIKSYEQIFKHLFEKEIILANKLN